MAENLSAGMIQEFKQAFALFDKEGDGIIPVSEIGTVMHELGQNLSKKEIQDLINYLDPDNNGTIEFPLFLEMVLERLKNTDCEDEIREAFRVFDKDGNGLVQAAEVRYVLIHHGDRLTEAEVDEMIAEVHINKDGMINYEDLVFMLMKGDGLH